MSETENQAIDLLKQCTAPQEVQDYFEPYIVDLGEAITAAHILDAYATIGYMSDGTFFEQNLAAMLASSYSLKNPPSNMNLNQDINQILFVMHADQQTYGILLSSAVSDATSHIANAITNNVLTANGYSLAQKNKHGRTIAGYVAQCIEIQYVDGICYPVITKQFDGWQQKNVAEYGIDQDIFTPESLESYLPEHASTTNKFITLRYQGFQQAQKIFELFKELQFVTVEDSELNPYSVNPVIAQHALDILEQLDD